MREDDSVVMLVDRVLIRVERFVALDKLRGGGDLVEVLGHVDPIGLRVQGPDDLPVTRCPAVVAGEVDDLGHNL